ncbi:hypothetical protein SAY87_008989 [Trapa incisa]|uniref:Uncharacterized protein n=1 Tax=Trapa incisa TaxID=236973 RepID=A0AAN7JY08_9MYRT|nr:hypothetical protein SAY87_008989 [Trapa incisa]
MDRERKKHDHATYSASRVFKIRDQIAKKKRESQELEMSIYLHDIYWFLKGYNQFSPTELSSLCQYLQDAWSECVRRIQYIDQVNHATRGGEGHLLPQEEVVMQ